jgi:hypothetical protein
MASAAKSAIIMVAPPMSRAFTFFLDSLWGVLLNSALKKYMPSEMTSKQTLVVAVVASIAFHYFARWTSGDFHILGVNSKKNPSAGDPNEGVFR